MAKLAVSMDSNGEEITIFASPQTLREIADQVEVAGAAFFEDALAVDLDEPVSITFSQEV